MVEEPEKDTLEALQGNLEGGLPTGWAWQQLAMGQEPLYHPPGAMALMSL